MTINDLFLLNQ